MPIVSTFELFEKQVTVGVWKITESQSILHSQIKLSKMDQERFLIRKKPKHQKSFLASRLLLQQMGVDLDVLYYKKQTIPMLNSNQSISISHTTDYVVIALSQGYEIGVDMEKNHTRIKKLADKFTNPKDYTSMCSLDSVAHLTRIWTAKEAMYKALKKNGVSFKHQMVVTYENHLGIGKYFVGHRVVQFDLNFIDLHNYSLCVCCKK